MFRFFAWLRERVREACWGGVADFASELDDANAEEVVAKLDALKGSLTLTQRRLNNEPVMAGAEPQKQTEETKRSRKKN